MHDPLALFANKCLTEGWRDGPWIDVACPNGDVTTIHFEGLSPDKEHLRRSIGDGVGRVCRWYDQSGNGMHAEQRRARCRPLVRLDIEQDGATSIVFDSVATGPDLLRREVYLDLPVELTVAEEQSAMFVVGRASNSFGRVAFAQLGTSDRGHALFSGLFGGGSRGKLTSSFHNGILTRSATATLNTSMFGWRSAPAAAALPIDAEDGAPVALKGGYIGKVDVGAYRASGRCEIDAVCLFGRTLNAEASKRTAATLRETFAVERSSKPSLVFDGDSIVEGYGSGALRSAPRQMLEAVERSFSMYVTASYGDMVENRRSNLQAISHYRTGHADDTLFIMAGSNDLERGHSAADTYSNLCSYIKIAHEQGWRVVCSTVLPRAMRESKQVERRRFNQLLRANCGGKWGSAAQWDALADADADDLLGREDQTRHKILYTDGTHLTELGYDRLQAVWSKAIIPATHSLPKVAPRHPPS